MAWGIRHETLAAGAGSKPAVAKPALDPTCPELHGEQLTGKHAAGPEVAPNDTARLG